MPFVVHGGVVSRHVGLFSSVQMRPVQLYSDAFCTETRLHVLLSSSLWFAHCHFLIEPKVVGVVKWPDM